VFVDGQDLAGPGGTRILTSAADRDRPGGPFQHSGSGHPGHPIPCLIIVKEQ